MTNPANQPPRDADASKRKPRNERSESESTIAGGLLKSFNRLPQGVQTTIKTIGFVAALITVWFLSRVSTTPIPVATVPVAGAEDSQQEYAERLALAKSRREQALALGSSVESLLKDLDESIGKWTGVQDLLRNEDGKLLAGNPQFVSAFSALGDVPRATHDQANSWRQALRTLIEPIEAAHKTAQSSYAPGEDSIKEFARLKESISQALEPYRRDLASIEAMRTTARQQNQPTTHTLAEAITRKEQDSALQSAQMLAEREQKVRYEADEKLAAANEQKIRALAAEKVNVIAAETKSEQFKMRAMREDVRAKYKPFLEIGRFRPHRNRMEAPGPMSYADLKTLGVFDDLKTFVRAGAGCWRHQDMPDKCVELGNDRTQWSKPQRDDDFDPYRERFQEFCELAPIWAQDGTLNP